jgi:hypothetical protein
MCEDATCATPEEEVVAPATDVAEETPEATAE